MNRRVASLLAAVLLPVAPAAGADPSLATAWVPTATGTFTSAGTWMFPDGTAIASRRFAAVDYRLLRSSDAGATWSELPDPPGHPMFATRRLGFAVLSNRCEGDDCLNEVHRTTDGGRRWHQVTPLPGPRPDTGVQQFTGNWNTSPTGRTVVVPAYRVRKLAACRMWEDDALRMYVSRDQARTWRTHRLPATGHVMQIEMLDDTHGALWMHEHAGPVAGLCDSGTTPTRSTVWVTHDGARSWRRTALTCRVQCLSVAMPAPGRLVVGMHWGVVVTSDDRGRDQREVRLVPPGYVPGPTGTPAVWDFAFPTSRVGFAILMNGGIWRTTDGGANWVVEPSPAYLEVPDFYSIAASDAEHAIATWPIGVLTRTRTPVRRP